MSVHPHRSASRTTPCAVSQPSQSTAAGYVLNDKHPKSIRVACDRPDLKRRSMPQDPAVIQLTNHICISRGCKRQPISIQLVIFLEATPDIVRILINCPWHLFRPVVSEGHALIGWSLNKGMLHKAGGVWRWEFGWLRCPLMDSWEILISRWSRYMWVMRYKKAFRFTKKARVCEAVSTGS